MSVAERVRQLKFEISECARRAGRQPEDVALIAVSKTKPSEMILEAIAAGQVDFGENYVQEALAKQEFLAKTSEGAAARWHFIGGLQTNKVAQVIGRFALIHSVDREKLVEALSKEAVKRRITQDILIQVNLGEEQTKGGITPDRVTGLVQAALQSPGLRVQGLMALPPLADEAETREYFRELRRLAEACRQKLLMTAEQKAGFRHLSMGTSHDYRWAIEEGATVVRIGTALFGEREKG